MIGGRRSAARDAIDVDTFTRSVNGVPGTMPRFTVNGVDLTARLAFFQ